MVPSVIRSLLVTTTLLAALAVPAEAQLRATLVASGFNRPLGFIQHPTDATVQLVLEQGGRIRVLKNGVVQPSDFLNLSNQIVSGGEQGLLGLAFAPDFATSGRVFASFTDLAGNSVIARFTAVPGDPLRADPSTRFDLMWPGGLRFIVQPFANHNGGNIAFGPDGFFYVGFGDGGSANDPFNNAQNPSSLLGKMLRLDVQVPSTDAEGYDVPPTNPFVGRAGVFPEIWAIGLRNPWRWSFDDLRLGGTGALVIGDVGQGAWEEVDYQPNGIGGLNYGWRNREGAHNNITSPAPFSSPLEEPISEYSHGVGQSITGGYVYRGRALGNGYVGRYFFGDFVSSRVWSLQLAIDPVTHRANGASITEHTAELAAGAASPSSFGVDAKGEIYVVSYNGAVYRIDGPPGQAPADPPASTGVRRGSGDGRARPR